MNSAFASLTLPAEESPQRSWVARAGDFVWRAFEASGQARARRELLDFATHCEAQQPELARELRAASRHNPLAGL